tara:strand:+ start:45 stop:365 length:321 start_codon:yes stop_codon:yes gene_type:complete
MKEIIIDDISFKVGQNAQENWDLLSLDENFTWFHLKSFPSCHVIIEKIDPSNDEIMKGANLCLENTKYRNLKNIKINYTLIKNIVKSDKIGSVTFKSNRKVKTVMI